MTKIELGPIDLIQPGLILADALKELNKSAAELARKPRVPSNRVDQRVN